MVALLLDFHLMCLQSFVYQLFCCISVVTIAQNFEVIFPQITSEISTEKILKLFL